MLFRSEQGSSSRSAIPAPRNGQQKPAASSAGAQLGSAPAKGLDLPQLLDQITGLATPRPASEQRASAAWSTPLTAPDRAWGMGSSANAPAGRAPAGPGPEPEKSLAAPAAAAEPQLIRLVDTDYYYASGTVTATGSTSTSTSVAPSPVKVQGSGTNLSFQLSWDTSVATAPSGFVATITDTAQRIANTLSAINPVSINLQIGWGSVHNSPLPSGALGASSTNLCSYGTGTTAYNKTRSLLNNCSSGSVIDTATLGTAVPATNPLSSSGGILLTYAQAKAIGVPISQ